MTVARSVPCANPLFGGAAFSQDAGRNDGRTPVGLNIKHSRPIEHVRGYTHFVGTTRRRRRERQ